MDSRTSAACGALRPGASGRGRSRCSAQNSSAAGFLRDLLLVCEDLYRPHFFPAVAVGQGPQEGQHAAGTRVCVTNFGKVYTTHGEFIDRLGVRDAAGFTYNFSASAAAEGAFGVVLSSMLRSEVEGGCVYAIRMDQSSRVFIIAASGIEVVESEPAIAPTPAPCVPVNFFEFEYFPNESLAVSQSHRSDVGICRTAIDANGVISSVDGILPHIPTAARAFRERLRSCPNPAIFSKELQQLWKILFRPFNVSSRSPLVMTHAAAFEFAINELLLACEECRFMEPIVAEESKALAPLHFLKQDPAFLQFASQQISAESPVSSVR